MVAGCFVVTIHNSTSTDPENPWPTDLSAGQPGAPINPPMPSPYGSPACARRRDRQLNEGKDLAELLRALEVSESSCNR
jgi:hypothetical protein